MDQVNEFEIRLEEIKKVGPQLSQGIQLLLLIDGELTVETDSRYYNMEEKDLLVINRNELFQLESKSKNRLLIVSVSDRYMTQHFDHYFNSRFECFSKEVDMGRKSLVKAIQKSLAEMLLAYYRRDDSYKIELKSHISKILLILIRRFRHKANGNEKLNTDDQRMKQIITYLEDNYHQPITLESTACKFYLSSGYLSRYFKQKMGIGFNRYLMEIRMKHAMKDLIYTTDTIGKIAANNGFPNAKSFARLFKEMYNETAKQYREKHQKHSEKRHNTFQIDEMKQTEHARRVLAKLRSFYDDNTIESFDQTEWRFDELTIDVLGTEKQKFVHPKTSIHIGELHEVLKAEIRSQLLMVKKDFNLSYVGVRRLIHGSTITPPIETDERIATTSPYYNADFALNFIQQQGISLFVIADYQEITEDEDHYFQELQLFIKHCLNVHGVSFVSSWNFIFYEPMETAASSSELERVYLKLHETLKSLVPNINVGLFIPFSFKGNRTGKSHQWILERDVPMDFIGYEANQNEAIDYEELGEERFALVADYLKEKTARFKDLLRKYEKEKPLHLIGWNTLTGNTRFTNGNFFRGALVFKHALEFRNEFESISFWINTEQHEKNGKNRDIRLEGMELFHYYNGKRPAYFAMQFLNRLQGEIVAVGQEYVMTKNERGYQLVLINYNNVNPYYAIEDNYLRKLNKEVHVTLYNLYPGEYQIRKYILDKDHGALYKKWLDLNSKYGIDEEVIQYINQTSQPQMEIFDKTFEKEWSFYSYLTYNAIHFYDIRRIY